MEVPVYLFTGFFESGKTHLIQESLEDTNFNRGERTLILMCEEGMNEYDLSVFPKKNVWVEAIDEVDQLTATYLTKLEKTYKAQRVIVEYNGMWPIDELFRNIPKNWMVYQEIMLADASTFLTYNTNMRQQMVDKLSGCEMVIMNRCDATSDEEKMEIHKVVRGVSRRADIAYEYSDGRVEYDQIEDPLPFDVEADEIAIEDKDFALWYRDLMEEPKKYEGKTVLFKGLVARHKKLSDSTFLVGRHVMVCCAEDISYKPIVCEADAPVSYENRAWLMVKAKVEIYKHKMYKDVGPVLHLISATPAAPPEQEVATFY